MAELSSESKELIRKYMVTLIVLPASVLSVLGFALGWFVNEGARGAAYSKAYGDAQQAIIKLASSAAASAAKASLAESNAKKVSKELDKSLKTVSKITAEAEVYGRKLTTVIKAEKGLANEVAKSLLKSTDTLTQRISQEYGERLSKAETLLNSLEATQWYDMLTPPDWTTNKIVKCREWNGWIEFKGTYSHPAISGWPAGNFLLLPEPCRPKTTRETEMPCHAEKPSRNSVCNNDFYTDGTVIIYTDFPVTQQRFEGVRIWKGE